MYLNRSRVLTESFNANAYDLLHLELLEDAIQYAALGPAIHARVDGVPVPKTCGKAAPLASLLGYIQNGIQRFKVAQSGKHLESVYQKPLLLQYPLAVWDRSLGIGR
jgi:hypothetical protein